MISSDMEEVIGVSDRIVVMHEGRIGGFLARPEFSEENVMRLAVGKSGHAGSGGRDVLKKDLGLFILILVVGTVVAILNPRFLSPINLGNTANLVGLFGLFSIGEASSSSPAASTCRSARCSPCSASSSSTCW